MRLSQAHEHELDAAWRAAPLGFAASEHAVLLGDLLDPTSVQPWTAEGRRVPQASEIAAGRRLRWLAIDAALVEHDSTTDAPAPMLVERLLRSDPSVDEAALAARLDGLGARVLLPAEADDLRRLRARDGAVAALVDDGSIVDLGPLGAPAVPVADGRTLYGAAWPWQLVRPPARSTRRALADALDATRTIRAALASRAARVAPGLTVLEEEAYLVVRTADGVVPGLSLLLRRNPWRGAPLADVTSMHAVCRPHPRDRRSRLAAIVAELAQRTLRSERDVARDWFGRYCELVVASFVRLRVELGLLSAPRSRDVLLELEEGWPARAVYRGSWPGAAAVGRAPRARGAPAAAEQADERLIADLVVDNALGVVGALGAAGCIDERVLLRDLRACLSRERARHAGGLLDRVLDGAQLPCRGTAGPDAGGDAGDCGAIVNPLCDVAI